MSKQSTYKDFVSMLLRKHANGNEEQVAGILSWVAISSLFIFLVFVYTELLKHRYIEAMIILIGLIPIITSLILIKKGMLLLPTSILAVSIILLITYAAMTDNGIHNVAMMGFPVVLIVTGLILKGRIIPYLTSLIILCMAWLVFGDIMGLYDYGNNIPSDVEDFFFASAIMIVTSNAVYLLIMNIHQSLELAQNEITERMKVEKEREELIHQLKLKNQELDRFAITLSHDLKTPLITVAGYLGHLEKDIVAGDSERVKKDVNQINDAAKSMAKLVDDILDLSRIGRLMNPPKAVPFGKIVEEAQKAAEGVLNAKQITISVISELPIVYCDYARMVQVLLNLITNSVKFMGEQTNPSIEIGVENREGEIYFFVRDNGIGINPKHHEQIFGLFSKLDPKIDGSGIG
ncbi:MAG: hypothetical protein H7Y59_15315, partial [Anaerolineales bacterium]|nr:hypothetical protein [Anaerolineales bacterium]